MIAVGRGPFRAGRGVPIRSILVANGLIAGPSGEQPRRRATKTNAQCLQRAVRIAHLEADAGQRVDVVDRLPAREWSRISPA